MDNREIFLLKGNCAFAPVQEAGECSKETLGTLLFNFKNLGFGLSSELFKTLSETSTEQVVLWYNQMLPILKKAVGAHKDFTPMYPNFPKQVMEASEAELYINALQHYWSAFLSDVSNGNTEIHLPDYTKEDREAFNEFHELRWIGLGKEKDFEAIFARLVRSNGSLSAVDLEILDWFIQDRDVINLIPENIPQKETLALLIAKLKAPLALVNRMKTATDVLRVSAAISGGDVSLAANTRFKSFSKSERRFLLSALEQCTGDITEDMLRHKNVWIKLGERLHPGDFKHQFSRSFEAFNVLRNNLPYATFNSQVEGALKGQDTEETLRLLKSRPGDFARRLDHILRTRKESKTIIESFLAVADRVATPLLLQLRQHFVDRNSKTLRVFFPKGQIAKVQVSEKELPTMSNETIVALAEGIGSVLRNRFAKLGSLGKVFIDPALAGINVPFAQRSSSRSLKTLARGSSMTLPENEGDTLRFFLWWKDSDRRTDIDLSALMLREDFSHHSTIAYYDLKHDYGCHSGDITSAPNGACEFIDVDLGKLKADGVRYIVSNVMSYTGQPFQELPECFAGWMMRESPQSGEVFEALSVKNKVDLVSDAKIYIPVIIDVDERKVFWADLVGTNPRSASNVSNQMDTLTLLARSVMELNKPNLFDLFRMHAEARGQIVSNPKDADLVFGINDGDVTAFMGDVILSEYLI
ncbi:MAG: Conserved hypothetical cytosolic protein [Candidatus Woesebacteria bacterium GW2011_GWB1_39_12]|uniref:Conserved hypothetical cytosolic protein n=1 Tax=Candidatus Woesebacteria bacterium GW2011_GWB1_39_12 TaxID=1618574 RepID=A0A0G0PM21_9BACT|nr:MAG: Conserved hypothetical cytosolic protein [Candidatus Woesebacteria bacterium GW2011_GWB1_39_12]